MAAGKKTGRTEYDSLLDAFCKKHPESAILYLNFLLRYADDEGFVPSFSIALSNGYAIDNLRDLEKAGLIVTPEPKTGISAIVYWNIISDIKPCRKKETIFQYEKSLLVLTDNNAYKKRVQKCTDKSIVQNGVQKCVQNCTQNNDGESNEQSEIAHKSVVFESVADSLRVGADTNAQQSNIYLNESNTDFKQSIDPKQSNNTQSFSATFSVDQKSAETASPNGSECVCSLFVPKNGAPVSQSRKLLLGMPPEQQKLFEAFWKAYPHKVDAPAAIRAWKKARVNSVLFGEIMKAIEREKLSDRWQRGIYKNPATWLNDCCWENEAMPSNQTIFVSNSVKAKQQSLYDANPPVYTDEELEENRRLGERMIAYERKLKEDGKI